MDIVITWVDGSDPIHTQARLNRVDALKKLGCLIRFGSYHESLYRDFDQLRYLFRSLESYAPWRGHIYLVTSGQAPSWLRLDHPRLSCISHDQIFSDKADLPTFNSRAIECHLHRIPGVSDRFLYFNDDVCLLAMTEKSDFLDEGKKIKLYLNPERQSKSCVAFCHNEYIAPIETSDALLDKKYGEKSRPMCCHTPYLIDKRMMEELQRTFPEAFQATTAAPFRGYGGIDPLHLYCNYLLDQKGCPLAEGPIVYYGLSSDRQKNRQVYEVLERYPPKFFCLNDDLLGDPLTEELVADAKIFYETIFPKASSYEN